MDSMQTWEYTQVLCLKKNIYDTNIGYKINAKTQIDIALYNVTNHKYSLFPGMPEMGTMGMATVKLDL
jgi:hypothetical protein